MIDSSKHIFELHFFVCTSEKEGKTSCAPTFNNQMVKEVKHWLKDEGLSPHIKLTRTSCMGYCNAEGGVMLSFPNGNVYQGLQTVEELKALIRKEISASQL